MKMIGIQLDSGAGAKIVHLYLCIHVDVDMTIAPQYLSNFALNINGNFIIRAGS